MRPSVSIVIATYNSSHLLRYALLSVLGQTVEDWEAIVVGDCCTDDSAEVVASFGDPRIRFVNLESNSGQQATPNNVGVGLARGEFLAFLNHDDMFLPEHLQINLNRMARESADIICCPFAEIMPEQLDAIREDRVVAQVGGYASKGRYDPRHFHIASSWFLRRSLANQIGPWRQEDETYVTPSQDWLWRASRQGAVIRCADRVSLVVIACGFRKDSYRKRESREHDFIYRAAVAGDRLREEMMAQVLASKGKGDAARNAALAGRSWPRWCRKVRRAFDRIVMRAGIHPRTPYMILRHGRRGGLIRHLKRVTG